MYSRALKRIREPQSKTSPNKLTIEYNKWLERKLEEKEQFVMIFLKERFAGYKIKYLEQYLELTETKEDEYNVPPEPEILPEQKPDNILLQPETILPDTAPRGVVAGGIAPSEKPITITIPKTI